MDLGAIGNAAWQHFPEAREDIKELLCDELQRAIDEDETPKPVDDYEYVIHAIGPTIFHKLGVVDIDQDLVERFCLFCRDVLKYSGPDRLSVSYTFNMYVLDSLNSRSIVDVVRRTDPELVELVTRRYPGRWAEND
ncbi:hypothetical protein OG994_21810 [Micromonospora globbae]|uniref:Macro domain-containing protein n=1 Tax=Micromonospora globbae TaxID=1894969 RepID=A0ABZ1S3B9_9ACTN|nr:hypothetical protein [Micromonospora globbae]